ncbi:MAG: preprotein translocase subunit SecA, partial [Candidatus Rokubacteria bacterium RIFCSPLOWO2_12_FULL_71_19]
MFGSLVRAIFGTKHERDARRMRPTVEAVTALEPEVQQLADGDLRARTEEFRKRLAAGEVVEDLLAEAFAVCREAARRTVRMRHFDVQLMGGIVLHEGKIAEMATGEGKTLVATLPAYLNALPGLGTHVVTVNDYLARRDAQWMGPIYHALGLSVGVIQHEVSYLYDPDYPSPDIRLASLRPCSRREGYQADITYGTNNEFGFDYLRDNMRFSLEEMVQREHHYAIVDEVDSILIDEARTPLIISGPAEGSTEKYYKIDRIIPKLTRAATIVEGKLSEIEALAPGDYIVDEKSRAVSLTEQGISDCERLLGLDNLYDPSQMEILHHIHQALKAHALFKKDVDYVVKDGQVVIVDEFTGRLMPGRRWSDGLHQAVEAKEGVRIESENQTLATITLQNYFRMYDKLAGMTGTAATEAEEFAKIYTLDVTVVPTNRPLTRVNHADVVYKTAREKFEAASTEIAACHARGQPVLVGTVSIETSEHLSRLLKKRGIPHQVLNAKYHEREAEIVAQAGREGAVTIATNMAGRGTDILLGGNPDFLAKEVLRKKGLDPATAPAGAREAAWAEAKKVTDPEHERVVALGGLHIIGTERHESRRIDNQLRGRAGRQGDPGSSRFYLSLEDDLLRIFGSERIQRIMDRLGMEEGEPIEHKLVTRAIGTAQKRVETRNFEIRKHLLEYDDVMNKQREIVYGMRREILDGESQEETVLEWIGELVGGLVDRYAPADAHPDDWDLPGLGEALHRQFDFRLPGEVTPEEIGSRDSLMERVAAVAQQAYRERERQLGPEMFHRLERWIMLGLRWEDGEFRGIDQLWKDHLLNMDHLKEGIGLRGYGQRDPLTEYKKEAFEMFQEMVDHLKEVVLEQLFKV